MIEFYNHHKRKIKKLLLKGFIYLLIGCIIGLCFLNYKLKNDKKLAEYKLQVYESEILKRIEKTELFQENVKSQLGMGNEGIWVKDIINKSNQSFFQRHMTTYQRELQAREHGKNYKLRYEWMVNPLEEFYINKSGEFGYPRIFKEQLFNHTGCDLCFTTSKIIISPFDGIVKAKGYDDLGGNYVIIQKKVKEYNEKNKIYEDVIYESYKGHLEKIDVEIGDDVKQGQRIGIIGKTGDYCSKEYEHLHWSIKRNGILMNPYINTTWHNKIIDSIKDSIMRY